MIKTILLVLAVALVALLAYAATRPDTFAVTRSATIQAPAQKLHPLIADLRAFNTWNPYAKKDPAMRITYRGPASGPGAAYDFDGNKDAGSGSIELLSDQPPSKVTMELHMIKPMEGRNTIEFDLKPQGYATVVTWSMHGPAPYISKLAGIFLDMDKMIGRDFEAGLANLKAAAEQR
ncbi:MAG: polyketide cyclase [Aquabacterium sp.]|nr:MAG: polyketide cyclase [Aquabacterium sp.]